MRAATGWATRGALRDPLTYAVGLVALVVYELHGHNSYLSRDLAVYGYAGQQVAEGVPPYVGILNRAGPLAHLIPGIGVLGARIVEIDDLLGMRLFFMLIAVACVCVVYLLGREVFASPLAGLASAAALLTFHGIIEYASNGPREKTPMLLFLLCALLATAERRWFLAGLWLSLGTLVLQPVFPVGLVAVLTVLAVGVPPRDWLRASVRFALGGLVPLAACIAYFAAVDALRAFVDAFLLINAEYTEADPLLAGFEQHWSRMEYGYGVSLWVMVVGLGALWLLSVRVVSKRSREENPATIPVTALGAAALAALAWSFRDFDDWPDAFLLLPFAALGVGGLVAELVSRTSARVAVAATTAWVLVAVAVAVSFSVTQRDHRLVEQRASVAAVLARLPDEPSILSINAPQALVLSGQTNPVRHQMFAGGLDRYVDDTWPGGLEAFGDWIGREQPTLLTIAGEPRPWVADTVGTEYRRVGRVPGWVWYVHRSVGRDAVSTLRRAAR